MLSAVLINIAAGDMAGMDCVRGRHAYTMLLTFLRRAEGAQGCLGEAKTATNKIWCGWGDANHINKSMCYKI
ncbi:hypothetical protein GCM10007159_12760 [Modicisalibacter luteus]|nr:hypothetical protein GCM10007159_12760 [Halomonas lutea]